MRAAWEMRAPVTDALARQQQRTELQLNLFHYLSRPVPDTSLLLVSCPHTCKTLHLSSALVLVPQILDLNLL